MITDAEVDQVEFREVNAGRWPDFERLFSSPGGPKACWCMVWRATAAEARRRDGVSRKRAIADRVNAGVPIGLLGYLDGEPVAWCSVAPRSTYRRLTDDDSSDDGIWSIACFFVVRRLRGQGMARRIIEAAVAHARAHGATVVEAYPVDPDSPSYRFMGFVPWFEKMGFHETGRAGVRRHVMRLDVRSKDRRIR